MRSDRRGFGESLPRVISFGKFSLAGIGLASVVGVILNLIIPDKKEAEEVNA